MRLITTLIDALLAAISGPLLRTDPADEFAHQGGISYACDRRQP